jgi:hypothetical protein
VTYFSLQAGGGSGASAFDYPARTLVRDEKERLRAEREQCDDGVERDEVEIPGRGGEAGSTSREPETGQGRQRDRTPPEESPGIQPATDRPVPYLLSEDSPLLLINIPEYVTDPDSAIEATTDARLLPGQQDVRARLPL